MSFQGDVAGIGLGELLQGLARGGREGVLTLRAGTMGATIGVAGGQIHLLPEPDEDPEIWRKRCERAWVKDPNQRIDTLRMSEIAARLELHTSTVSRAIAGKHVATEFGLYRLRDFFDGARMKGGDDVAGQGRLGIAQQIADLVAAEDKATPLSDDDLLAALATKGVQAARRTIAKYRHDLGIPSSYRRRQFRGG